MSKKDVIFIVAQDYSLRSLLAAQLQEEGYDVLGLRSINDTLSGLTDADIQPSLLIMDLRQITPGEKSFQLLSENCAAVPLLLLHGASDRSREIEWKGSVNNIVRPLTIGQIVDRVKYILQGNPIP